mmetsp:Transcript_58427/g.139372  ORF Transcript_58427/g.139372 Transcript_58427/m.139372 type:complete len:571 (-) Transcript_58427:108-1820(-)
MLLQRQPDNLACQLAAGRGPALQMKARWSRGRIGRLCWLALLGVIAGELVTEAFEECRSLLGRGFAAYGPRLTFGRVVRLPRHSQRTACRSSCTSTLSPVSTAGWDVGTWHGEVATYDMRPSNSEWKPSLRAGSKELYVLRSALSPAEVSQVLQTIGQASFLEEAEGSKNPVQTPVCILKAKGRWVPGVEDDVRAAVEGVVEDRILPFMRKAFASEDLIAAEVLVRRYVPEEKKEHALHFDHHAAATCVVDLAPQPGSGLFVQPGPHRESRFFVPLETAGDAAVHAWDTFHGVALEPGHERVSLIVWAKSPNDAEEGTTTWYEGLGASGDIDAAYRLGARAEAEGDRAAAEQWHRQAAEGGHWMAMTLLSRLLVAARGPADEEAQNWVRQAAELGWAEALVDDGDLRMQTGDVTGALTSYQKAADQKHPAGLHRVAMAHLRGQGTPQDPQTAEHLLQQSASLGWADAQYALALSFSKNAEEQVEWLEAAASLGHPAAANSLAIVASKLGRHEEARRWLQFAAERGHAKAMANLSLYLARGVGGEVDEDGAARWAAEAARRSGGGVSAPKG